MLGLLGIPVFAGFTGGAAVLAGPTGGFIAGYAVCALNLRGLQPQGTPLSRSVGSVTRRRFYDGGAFGLLWTGAFMVHGGHRLFSVVRSDCLRASISSRGRGQDSLRRFAVQEALAGRLLFHGGELKTYSENKTAVLDLRDGTAVFFNNTF